jgi:hypothetical protein
LDTDIVMAAEEIARAVAVDQLGPDGLTRVVLRVDHYTPREGAEPQVSVRLARVQPGEPDWRGAAFLLRTARTPGELAWAVRQATRGALQQLGLL